jgi:hypothetical protein
VPARGQVHQHLPGGDADAHGQLQARVGPVELLDGGQHAERAARRPLGVVLVGEGGAEHGHGAVADELVQGAAQPLDLGPQPGVVGPQQGADVLGVGLVGAGGEAHQVAEQHRDDLALLAGPPGGGGQEAPQAPQNRNPSGFSWAHTGQFGLAAAYGLAWHPPAPSPTSRLVLTRILVGCTMSACWTWR